MAATPTKKITVAVTGGSGQLGTHVLRRLAADRRVARVVSLDVRPPVVVGARVEAVHADVRDPEIGRHLAGCDALIHLAFIITDAPGRAIYQSINVDGSRNVLRAAAAAGVRRIIYSSSVAAYGVVPGHPVPIVESTPRRYQPGFAYSACKYEVEAFLDEFEPAHPEIAIARLRPTILVGGHMDHGLGDLLRKRQLLAGHGAKRDVPMPLVWDEDVADAVLLALHQEARGAFNLSADEQLSPTDLARATGLRLVSIPRPVLHTVARLSPLLARTGLIRRIDPAWLDGIEPMLVSSARARAELGWKPRCNTATAVIQRYLEVVPARLDRRIAVFFRMIDLAARYGPPPPHEMRRVSARIHLQLTGPGGGDLDLALDHGRLTVRPGVPRPPTVVMTLKATTLLDLLASRTDYATAQMTGRLRVEGEALAGVLLQGIIGMFHQQTRRQGAVGWTTRRLAAWFATPSSSPTATAGKE